MDELPSWRPGAACALVTLDVGGDPHVIPVSAARPAVAPEPVVVFALAARRGSLARLRDDGRAALLVLDAGLSITLRGRAAVLEEAPDEAPGVVVCALRVEALDDHGDPATVLDGPLPWHWQSRDAAERDLGVHRALARHAASRADDGRA